MKTCVKQGAIYEISPVKLDPSMGLKRESPRPAALRSSDFDERFDFDTLFYDVFRIDSSNKIFMIGPALYNLAPYFSKMTIRAHPSGVECRYRIFEMDRLTRFVVDAPAETTELILTGPFGKITARVSPSCVAHFQGLRTLCTISRNNDIAWICDWARFCRDIHGAQAILLYDNSSTAYTVEELLAELMKVDGIAFVGVVSFPFRFGPPGVGLRRHWDSNFLQIGSLEHARWRFLNNARSVLNSDVDELILSRSGESVFEAAERNGLVRFFGAWVPNIKYQGAEHPTDAIVRHIDFSHVERTHLQAKPPNFVNCCQPKWAVVPNRIPWEGHMTHHRIKNWWRSRLWTRDFVFRHFRGLSTNWKYDRARDEIFDPKKHRLDQELLDAFSRVDWTR